MKAVEQIDVLLLVVAALEKLSIRYCVGGSFASSIYEIARATRDVDMLAEIKPDQAKELVAELQSEFYVDEQAIRSAVNMSRQQKTQYLLNFIGIDEARRFPTNNGEIFSA